MLLHKNQTATLLFFCIVRIFLHNNIHMDILPECLIYSNLGKIGMVVFFCHHHLKFYTLASLGQDDILQFFLCFRIIYISFSKEILKFDVENRFTGLAIVFGNRLLEHLFENAAGLTYYYFISTLITILQFVASRLLINEDKVLARLEENQKKPKKKKGFMARIEQMQKEQEKLMREQNNKRR